jgi:hypothetical protein
MQLALAGLLKQKAHYGARVNKREHSVDLNRLFLGGFLFARLGGVCLKSILEISTAPRLTLFYCA